jgi:hypothetical protein
MKKIKELEDELDKVKNQPDKSDNLNNGYLDEKYFMESQYIHKLKEQISLLVNQNDNLKIKIRELTEENEELKTLSKTQDYHK